MQKDNENLNEEIQDQTEDNDSLTKKKVKKVKKEVNENEPKKQLSEGQKRFFCQTSDYQVKVFV